MKNRTIALGAGVITAVLALGIPLAKGVGVRVNISTSAPPGVWMLEQIPASELPERFAVVEICPPAHPTVTTLADNGYLRPGNCLDSGLMPLLKPAAALPGDRVRISPGRPAQINGRAMTNTVPIEGLPGYPPGEYEVSEGEVWLFSSYNSNSLDSRYFGPVPLEQLRGQVSPVWVSSGGAVVATYEGEH